MYLMASDQALVREYGFEIRDYSDNLIREW